MVNRMIFNEMVWFGWGVINVLIDEVVWCGYCKVLIVIDSIFVCCGVVVKVIDKLDVVGLVWDIFSDVIFNLIIVVVQQGWQVF